MDRPPRPVSGPLPPTEPIPRVALHQDDTTVLDVGPPREPVGDGRPPKTPRWMLALIALVIAVALYWWFSQTQRAQEVALNATVTAVNQATATAEAVNAAASAAQATATVAQAAVQATAVVQSTAAAQGAVDAQSTAVAQSALAEQARATAQSVSVGATAQAASIDATVAAISTQAAPKPTDQPTPTPVVIVVTATAAPAASATPAPVAPVAPVVPVGPPPSQPAPPAAAPPVPGVQPPAIASPAPLAAASPVSVQPRPIGGAASITVTAGQPARLQCPDEHVRLEADPDELPARLLLTCSSIEPASVPPPPGPIVGQTVVQLGASPGDGKALGGTATLIVTYPADAVPSADRGKLTLAYLDGEVWQPLPEQTPDPATTQITAPVDRAGVYILYRQP